MISSRLIDPHDPVVAAQMHGLLMLAHAQEAGELQVPAGMPPTLTDLRARTAPCIGAYVGPELVGWLGLDDDDEPGQRAITVLVVHPGHQRRGMARLLVAEAIEQVSDQRLAVVAACHNTAALALYASLGFTAYRRGALGPQAIEVVKLRNSLSV